MYKKIKKLLAGKQLSRTPQEQKIVDGQTAALILYHFPACPYCHMVRREVHRLSLNIQQRDIRKSKVWHKELLRGGGKGQVPCLRIEQNKSVRWLYESRDITAYLRKRFNEPHPTA